MTFALSAVMVSAATIVYNFSDITGITYQVPGTSDGTDNKIQKNTELSFANITNSNNLISYEDAACFYQLDKTDAEKTITVDNITFSKVLVSANSTKKLFKLSVNAGDKVTVYFSGSDSKFVNGKPIICSIENAAGTDTVSSEEINFSGKLDTVEKITYTATADGDCIIKSSFASNRLAVFGIKIESGESGGDGDITNDELFVVDGENVLNADGTNRSVAMQVIANDDTSTGTDVDKAQWKVIINKTCDEAYAEPTEIGIILSDETKTTKYILNSGKEENRVICYITNNGSTTPMVVQPYYIAG